MRTKPVPSPTQNELVCPECGNRKRFVEVMAEETHLVDGSGTYIHLLDAVVDRYLCWECWATIEPEEQLPK